MLPQPTTVTDQLVGCVAVTLKYDPCSGLEIIYIIGYKDVCHFGLNQESVVGVWSKLEQDFKQWAADCQNSKRYMYISTSSPPPPHLLQSP